VFKTENVDYVLSIIIISKWGKTNKSKFDFIFLVAFVYFDKYSIESIILLFLTSFLAFSISVFSCSMSCDGKMMNKFQFSSHNFADVLETKVQHVV
jgi:hypothetical protein